MSPCEIHESINFSNAHIFPQLLTSLRPIKLSVRVFPPTTSILGPNTAEANSASLFCLFRPSLGLGLISSKWLLICKACPKCKVWKVIRSGWEDFQSLIHQRHYALNSINCDTMFNHSLNLDCFWRILMLTLSILFEANL